MTPNNRISYGSCEKNYRFPFVSGPCFYAVFPGDYFVETEISPDATVGLATAPFRSALVSSRPPYDSPLSSISRHRVAPVSEIPTNTSRGQDQERIAACLVSGCGRSLFSKSSSYRSRPKPLPSSSGKRGNLLATRCYKRLAPTRQASINGTCSSGWPRNW